MVEKKVNKGFFDTHKPERTIPEILEDILLEIRRFNDNHFPEEDML